MLGIAATWSGHWTEHSEGSGWSGSGIAESPAAKPQHPKKKSRVRILNL